jgi:hypothetical protein
MVPVLLSGLDGQLGMVGFDEPQEGVKLQRGRARQAGKSRVLDTFASLHQS